MLAIIPHTARFLSRLGSGGGSPAGNMFAVSFLESVGVPLVIDALGLPYFCSGSWNVFWRSVAGGAVGSLLPALVLFVAFSQAGLPEWAGGVINRTPGMGAVLDTFIDFGPAGVLASCFLPIPFALVAGAFGALGVNTASFVALAVIGRFFRFTVIAVIARFLGAGIGRAFGQKRLRVLCGVACFAGIFPSAILVAGLLLSVLPA